MSREYKFRGWSTRYNKWYYGSLIMHNKGRGGSEAFISTSEINYHLGCNKEVYPESVGQYTGIKDKNGKEIYEGDIVKREAGIHGARAKIFATHLVDVTFSHVYRQQTELLEVVGNIYEHPELINTKR